jgi:hypothetical protein
VRIDGIEHCSSACDIALIVSSSEAAGACRKRSSLASEGDTSEFAQHRERHSGQGEVRRVQPDYNLPTPRIVFARNAIAGAARSPDRSRAVLIGMNILD